MPKVLDLRASIVAAWRFAAEPRVDGGERRFPGRVVTGPEDCRERMKDDFEHPDMLYSDRRNRQQGKTDRIFGRHRGVFCQKRPGF